MHSQLVFLAICERECHGRLHGSEGKLMLVRGSSLQPDAVSLRSSILLLLLDT